MAVLIVPPLDDEPWPSLGGQVCTFLEERSVFGPGSLKGQPYRLSQDWRAALWRAYEVYPRGHELAGRRRYKRVGLSVRKGLAKTEFQAQVAFVELHPEAPVRFDGWDAAGQPVGRPVRDPYIPLLAYSKDQVEELAYSALYVIVTEGPDADLFDAGLDRILRLDEWGREDGKAVPLSGSPNSRDGARTTFQGFDEPHRLYLPRLREAHETMVANLEKRVLEDPWGLYVGTAGQPGQNSIAEDLHKEARKIARGEIDEPALFYLHREAGPGFDLGTRDGRVAAVADATGPAGEYAPGQFLSIARQWERTGADEGYLERVWLNRWVQQSRQAFDMAKWSLLVRTEPRIADGAFVTGGFDGARLRDATALVLTDVATGLQVPAGIWQRRETDPEDWEVPEDEVTATLEDVMGRYAVWRVYGDPPHWTETMGSWAGRWPDRVVEWWTNRPKPMAYAVRAYVEAIDSGAVGHPGDTLYSEHVANAGRHDLHLLDDQGAPLFTLRKITRDRLFDAAMAGVLSWRARLDALAAGAKPPPKRKPRVVKRLR